MSRLFDELVKKRGFSESFLRPKYENLPSPWLLPDAKKAIERIKKAIKNKEVIILYGDYDADGVTASTVMKRALEMAGLNDVEIMLPDRFKDGYGMSEKIVERAKEIGAKLVITVDCGSGNKEIVQELKDNDIDTIVTDHHECAAELPKAVAVVNPKRRDIQKLIKDFDKYVDELMDLRELAGVGVAFMLVRGMVEDGMVKAGQEKWLLDLVLIGTICDSMRMNIVNRILCFYGMRVLKKTRSAGLKELIRVSKTTRINAETIGFQIGPRLNAAGRMASANIALNLLQTTSRTEAARLAEELERLNTERKNQQMAAMREFEERGVSEDPVLVTVGKWHEGILGIIAGKLVEEYRRPAFVFSKTESGILKGSGRSFGDFSLADALKACEGTIVGGGGHAGAAGVKVSEEKLDDFQKEMNEYYRSLNLDDQEHYLATQADLETSELGGFTLDFLEELSNLEPFGVGNEVPVFGLTHVLVLDKRLLGAEAQHLRLLIMGKDGKMMKLMAFYAPENWRKIENGERLDILMRVEENEWNGLRSVEGRIVDLRGC
ncbi:single-stranded-DNA-specific exonuclease RecJ [Candidatus Saccharibacteria bacterium]|nr:single-stranded-DNA-specific exonuclease RecJ [Candidatus Saccharibacteria bacterium]